MRTLTFRSAAAGLLAIALLGSAAQAQVDAIVFGAGVGYIALSASAVARLLERGRTVAVGDSIRLVTREHGRPAEYFGTATSVGDDSISIEYADTTTTLAYRGVRRMHVYSGMESKWAEGWAVGFASGALIGALGSFSGGTRSSECDMFCPKPSQAPAVYGLVGAVVASTVTAGIGAFAEGPHWRSVNRNALPDDRRHMGLSPYIRPRRIGALLSVPLP
ncbi:MAG TPA: hypothetical protein VGM50_03825 [Gemmatimonadaceae bacterium]